MRERSVQVRRIASMVVLSVLAIAAVVVLAPASHAALVVPDPLPPGAPGEVIQTELVGPVTGGTRYRVLYHSRSVAGDDIAVSSMVFVPTAPAPPGGRKIIGWAHGTVGVADICAPSLGGYDPEYLADWLAAGYVVTATDYEGLGAPGRHPYLVGESEGRGVLDSLRAALAMPEADATNETVLFGHSQGGHAALFANELAPTYAPELNIVGTIAAAPASQLMAAWSIATSGPVVRAAVVMMGAGFAQSYPALDLADIYTPEAIARMGIVDTGCQSDVVDAYADLSQTEMIHTTPDAVPSWNDAVGASEPGFRVGASPVLIVHGTADEEVPYEATQSLSERMCATGQAHELVTYPGQNHSGIFGPAHDTILGWADARFAGSTPPNLCDGIVPPPPLVLQAGECGPTSAVVPSGLPAISGPAVTQLTTEATAIGSPLAVTAAGAVPPGGLVTYHAVPSDDLLHVATQVLEERVKPTIRDTYGEGLASTAWVAMTLTDVELSLPAPTGTTVEGAVTTTGDQPPMTAASSATGVVVHIPSITLDSRVTTVATTAIDWSVRDTSGSDGTTIALHEGTLSFALQLTIGVKFFGSDLVGGVTAPLGCLPTSAPLAETAVLADAVIVTLPVAATAVVVTPAYAG